MFTNIITTTPSELVFPEISVTSSPFALYPRDVLQPERRKFEYMTFLDLDKVIVELTNQMLLATTYLLMVELERRGIDFGSQNHIRTRISKMLACGYLTGYRFEGCKTLVLRVGPRGYVYLRHQGIYVQKTSYLGDMCEQQADTGRMKQLLSAVQYAVMNDVLSSTTFLKVLAEEGHQEPTDKIVRPTGIVELADRTVFLESVRGRNYQEALMEKLERYQKVCRCKRLNFSISEPVVILISESLEEQRELMTLLDGKRFGFQVCFTSDPIVYSGAGKGTSPLFKLPEKKSFFERLLAG